MKFVQNWTADGDIFKQNNVISPIPSLVLPVKPAAPNFSVMQHGMLFQML